MNSRILQLIAGIFSSAAALVAQSNLPVDLPAPVRPAASPDAGLKSAGPDSVRVSVVAVTNLRSTASRPDAGTTLQLAFSGSAALTGTRVTAVRLVRGQDDQGALLTRAPEGLQTPRFLAGGGQAQSPRLGSILLHGVSRTAEQLRFVEGEVDVVPLDTKPVMVLVPDFLAQAGRVLSQAGLAEQDMEIIPLTEATVARYANEYSGPALVDCACQAVFLIRDPGNVLAALTIEAPDGKPVPMQPRTRGGRPDGTLSVAYTLPNGLPEHAALRVQLGTPTAVRTLRFRLENVSLP